MSVRGFLAGVIWGGTVAVLGLGAVSQFVPMPGRNATLAPPGGEAGLAVKPAAALAPATATGALPAADAAAAAARPAVQSANPPPSVAPAAEGKPATPKPDAATPATAAPDGPGVATAAPEPENAPPVPAATDGIAPPAALVLAPAVLAAVQPPDPAPSVSALADDLPAAAGPAPMPGPGADAASLAANLPPAAPAPAPAAAILAIAPMAPAVPAVAAPQPPVAAALDQRPAALNPAQPALPPAEAAPDAPTLPPPPPLTAAENALLQPQPGTTPDGTSAPPPDLPTPAQPAPAALPRVIVLAPARTEGGSTLLPTPGLGKTAAGVTTNRLPRIGDAPPAEAKPADTPPNLRSNARPFENLSAKPLFAIILIDTGGPDVDRTSYAALPFPVSFAIDPAAADAATAAAIYRAAGQEVIMLATGIPPGATPSDLEVTFQANAAALPESVAVLDLESGGFQNDRPLASQVVPILKGQGRGLITWDKGLNAGDQVARRDGLASALVFRRLDGEGESAPTMRRYLDRAAFKAAQTGRVAVVGQTRPETVAALRAWSVEGRAATVALAPVTALLTSP